MGVDEWLGDGVGDELVDLDGCGLAELDGDLDGFGFFDELGEADGLLLGEPGDAEFPPDADGVGETAGPEPDCGSPG